jgi:hypothetical protein
LAVAAILPPLLQTYRLLLRRQVLTVISNGGRFLPPFQMAAGTQLMLNPTFFVKSKKKYIKKFHKLLRMTHFKLNHMGRRGGSRSKIRDRLGGTSIVHHAVGTIYLAASIGTLQCVNCD